MINNKSLTVIRYNVQSKDVIRYLALFPFTALNDHIHRTKRPREDGEWAFYVYELPRF